MLWLGSSQRKKFPLSEALALDISRGLLPCIGLGFLTTAAWALWFLSIDASKHFVTSHSMIVLYRVEEHFPEILSLSRKDWPSNFVEEVVALTECLCRRLGWIFKWFPILWWKYSACLGVGYLNLNTSFCSSISVYQWGIWKGAHPRHQVYVHKQKKIIM